LQILPIVQLQQTPIFIFNGSNESLNDRVGGTVIRPETDHKVLDLIRE